MILQVSRNTYSFTTAEVQAKQAELQAQHRKQRLIQVRRQEKQHAELQRQQYKENFQELAGLEQASFGQAWHDRSRLALIKLQQQLGASLAKTGQGQKAADAANQSAAVLAAHRTAEREARLQVAKQRFAQALQLKHLEQSTAVAADVTRLQRISDTIAAESVRAHALAQHHRAIQAEATTNSNLQAATNWSEAALRAIDYNHTRLHEFGVPGPTTVVVERNIDRGKAQCTTAADTAAYEQARCAFNPAVQQSQVVFDTAWKLEAGMKPEEQTLIYLTSAKLVPLTGDHLFTSPTAAYDRSAHIYLVVGVIASCLPQCQ